VSHLKYVARFQTAHMASLGDAEIERRLEALVRHFEEPWLSAENGHPIQKLWSRKDGLATNQLVLVGDALLFGEAVDVAWLARQVSEIKTGPDNNRRGAMFELLGANLIRDPPIRPTPRGFPGYDLKGRFADGSDILVSLKCYGDSAHETLFRTESRSVEESFLARLRLLGINGLRLQAKAASYPSKEDWRLLRDAIPKWIPGSSSGRGATYSRGVWAVDFAECPRSVQPLANKHLSAGVIFLAPFHKNESKNLLDKLEEAAVNARKHANAHPGTAHMVVVRIPETIALGTCATWAKEYVADHATGPVDAVILYQPTAADTEDGLGVLDHGHFDCFTPSYAGSTTPARTVVFSALVGTAFGGSRRILLNAPPEINMDNMYVYQRGNFYTEFESVVPGGPVTAQSNNLAPGIVRYAVLKLTSGEEKLVSGMFPPEQSLSIFD
jgi:hypothetical protein